MICSWHEITAKVSRIKLNTIGFFCIIGMQCYEYLKTCGTLRFYVWMVMKGNMISRHNWLKVNSFNKLHPFLHQTDKYLVVLRLHDCENNISVLILFFSLIDCRVGVTWASCINIIFYQCYYEKQIFYNIQHHVCIQTDEQLFEGRFCTYIYKRFHFEQKVIDHQLRKLFLMALLYIIHP